MYLFLFFFLNFPVFTSNHQALLARSVHKSINATSNEQLLTTLWQVSALTGKYERARREFARREDETAKLLDVRNHKINKLELQLRDIAYGTKVVKIEPTSDSDSPADYNISIERGQVGEILVSY